MIELIVKTLMLCFHLLGKTLILCLAPPAVHIHGLTVRREA